MMANSGSANLVDEMLSHLKADFVDYEPESQIGAFYANRCVFITGATGFIGKALIEKLIRSCKDIKQIYLLIREKRGKDIKERLNDLVQSQIFHRIKSQPNGPKLLESKLRAIRGDITLPKFGISEQDMEELASEVSIVFNSAATIRFMEPIDVAVRNNIFSVGQLVEFCNGLTSLEALIHLSTAYSNCHKRDTIYEIFYEPPMYGDQIINAVKVLKQIQNEIHIYPNISQQLQMDDAELVDDSVNRRDNTGGVGGGKQAGQQQQQPSADYMRNACKQQNFFKRSPNSYVTSSSGASGVGGSANSATDSGSNRQNITADLLDEFTQLALRRSNRPNTYTFTKAISEYYLLELVKRKPERYLNGKIPVAIVRPSIVGGAWREPDVGFVDNYNGGTGPILSLYTGALQAMPGRADRVADIVPIDMVCNMIISTGWFLVRHAEPGNEADKEAAAGSSVAAHRGNGDQQPLRPIKRDHGAYIFNFVSGYRNPLRWGLVTELIADVAYRYPCKMLYRLPSSYFIVAGPVYNLYDFLNHKMVAKALDFVRASILREELTSRTSALAGYNRIRQMTETLTPFTTNQWRLSDSNVSALYQRLAHKDKQLFQFDVAQIEWPKYIKNYILGSRIYTLKDEARNVPAAMGTLRKKQTINRVSMVILMLLFYYFFCHQTQLEAALLRTWARLSESGQE